MYMNRADLRLAPSLWEMSLQSNAVSHWLCANLESALHESLMCLKRSYLFLKRLKSDTGSDCIPTCPPWGCCWLHWRSSLYVARTSSCVQCHHQMADVQYPGYSATWDNSTQYGIVTSSANKRTFHQCLLTALIQIVRHDQAALWMVLSVCLSHLFHHVPVIVSSWNFCNCY